MNEILDHLGFGRHQLGDTPPTLALISGDPFRARAIAEQRLKDTVTLSENRGLFTYLGRLKSGAPVLSTTSGMGGPSISIVLNELVQVGIRTVIRIGTSGSIQEHVDIGSLVISSASLC